MARTNSGLNGTAAVHLLSSNVLTRSTSWNVLGAGVPLVVGVVSIPLILRELGAERFGILTLAWIFIGYFSLFDFGLGRALTQAVARALGEGQNAELPGIVGSGLVLMAGAGVIAGAVCLAVMSRLITAQIPAPGAFQNEIDATTYVISATVPVVVISSAFRGILEAQQGFGWSNVIRIPLGALSYVAPLLVLPFTRNLAVVVAAISISRLFGLIAYVLVCLRLRLAIRPTVTLHRIKRLLRFGSWVSITNIVYPITTYVDRFVIAAMMPFALIAYYTTPSEAVSRILVFPVAVGAVLFPAFATGYGNDRLRTTELYERASKYTFICLFPFLLATAMFSRELLAAWVGVSFSIRAAPVLALLSAGVLANGLAQMPYGLVQGAGHPDWVAKLQLVELPIYLVFLIVLVANVGLVGAAFAWMVRTSLDYFIIDAMSYRLLGKFGTLSWHRLFIPIGIVTVALASQLHGPLVGRLIVLVALVITVGASCWQYAVLPVERTLVTRYLRAASLEKPRLVARAGSSMMRRASSIFVSKGSHRR